MTENGDDVSGPRAGGDPAAIGLALGANTETAVDARAYLREQTKLARLQKVNLLEQNAFELSHLRWRRFNDQMKGALQIMIVMVGAVVVIALGAAMWNASQADGLVVEQFSVPPGFTAAGISGTTVADDLTQKIEAIREIANGRSLSVSKGVRNARDEEIRVDIPDTGISLAELWRYLRAWLGHERPVSGNVREEASGHLALTVAMAGVPAFTLEGEHSDLSKLEQQAAERLFGTTDPVNYVLFLAGSHRLNEAMAAAALGPALVSTPVDRADAYTVWGYTTLRIAGDPYQSLQRARIAIAIYPKLLVATRLVMQNQIVLGHAEAALALANTFGRFRREDQPLNQRGFGFDQLLDVGEYEYVESTGDFAQGLVTPCRECSWGDTAMYRAEFLARLHEVNAARAAFATSLASDPSEKTFSGVTQFYIDEVAGNWKGAASDIESYESDERASKTVSQKYAALRIKTYAQPLLARALAHEGDFTAAHTLIDSTPGDCVPCETARGDIDALGGNTNGAAYWFSRAIRDAPSIPFAYSDWGRLLLAKGDYDAAIAKFTLASQKGPHFADPLEMWGEALMLKNRSDLALAKFEDANKYAPNWGRLRMKWGEALGYVGRRDEARAQYRIASKLDLSVRDKAELARDTQA